MSIKPLVFYDIKREVPDKAEWAWSPNTWRVRLALNIKGIPYETKFIDFHEVAPTVAALGVEPYGPGSFLNLKYSAPVIHDPNTGRTIMDSHPINLYLEDQYPATPLYPSGTRALQAAFFDMNEKIVMMTFPANIEFMYETCSEEDKVYFRKSREDFFGAKLEEIAPKGEALEACAKGLEQHLNDLAGYIDANGPGAVFFGGDTPIAADADTAAHLLFLIKTVPKGHELRNAFERASGGRWVRYMDTFSKWTSKST